MLAALLALLAFQTMGWFVAWDLARTDARRCAAHILRQPKTQTHWRVLAPDALHRARVGKREIRLGGHLYDIRRAVPRGDSLLVELYHDAREEALLDALNALLQPAWATAFHTLPGPAPLHLTLLKWMGSAFLVPDGLPLLPDRLDWAAHFFFCSLPGSQVALPRPGPPPKGPDATLSC